MATAALKERLRKLRQKYGLGEYRKRRKRRKSGYAKGNRQPITLAPRSKAGKPMITPLRTVRYLGTTLNRLDPWAYSK